MKIFDIICYAFAGTCTVTHVASSQMIIVKQEIRSEEQDKAIARLEARPIEVEHDTLVNYVVDTVEKIVEIKVPFKVYVDTCERGFAAKGHYFVNNDSMNAPTTHGTAKYPLQKPHASPIKSELK